MSTTFPRCFLNTLKVSTCPCLVQNTLCPPVFQTKYTELHSDTQLSIKSPSARSCDGATERGAEEECVQSVKSVQSVYTTNTLHCTARSPAPSVPAWSTTWTQWTYSSPICTRQAFSWIDYKADININISNRKNYFLPSHGTTTARIMKTINLMMMTRNKTMILS